MNWKQFVPDLAVWQIRTIVGRHGSGARDTVDSELLLCILPIYHVIVHYMTIYPAYMYYDLMDHFLLVLQFFRVDSTFRFRVLFKETIGYVSFVRILFEAFYWLRS